MNYAKHREHLLEWMRSQLTGLVTNKGKQFAVSVIGRQLDPEEKSETLRGIAPLDRYTTGVLYPVCKGTEGIDPASVAEEDEENDSPEASNSTIQMAQSAKKQQRYVPPSSVGFSFFVRGKKIEFRVICSAVRYDQKGKTVAHGYVHDDEGLFTNDWYRIPLSDSDGDAVMFYFPACYAGDSNKKPFREAATPVLSNYGGIDVLWRPFADGWIVTVTLFNKQNLTSEDQHRILHKKRNENSLFEVSLRCVFEAGEVGIYPPVDKSLLTEEEQEIELQYESRHIYAIGHGAAADWTLEKSINGESIREIRAEFLPSVEVPQVTADTADNETQVLQIDHLAALGLENPHIYDELQSFITGYATWIEKEKQSAISLAKDDREIANRIIKRMETALKRMKQGVEVLRKNHYVAQSFAIANKAMCDQMEQYDKAQNKSKARDQYRWRPFQLAFLLCSIESVINEESEFRDTVDLIWFPAGGGKTEAYLGLIAFLIAWRRLTNPASGGGTTVLMRYTLRLLTAQQYLRATRMICALELIRCSAPALGTEPITVGMWVGMATTPNTFKAAREIIDKATSGNGSAPMELIIDRCPWCGKPFKAPDNYLATPTNFQFRCTNLTCDYGRTSGGVIPCNVVDEALYADPPTLLIATIDKFARLAWEERTNSFFGKSGNRPPELVIQDELHLISGALGSVAGLYEAALETVLIQRGIYPKYIASTATICMAQQQARRLYGKQMAVFPPPGLSCDDSYFARTIPLHEKPGRLYVGYLAPMLGRQPIGKTPSSLVPLAAVLLAAPDMIFADQENKDILLDAWWTQVVYHGSLKGVGNSHNAYSNDVREYMRLFTSTSNDGSENNSKKTISYNHRKISIAQLTSLARAEENARTFALLEQPRGTPECLNTVLATNMISVGLDVGRLALMIINGQPLTTAEYIQASSRIGRGDVPGLVFVNYYRDQARSLSHYENFRPYHEAFYRFVEPTSVTPYTYQTRTRALHAALVIAIRHTSGQLLSNSNAGKFNPDEDHLAKTIEELKKRCGQADRERASQTAMHIDKLVDEWKAEVALCEKQKRQMNYHVPDNDNVADRLLYNYNDKIKGCWVTPQSMRNVEDTALMEVK
jgi:hypothetical protein